MNWIDVADFVSMRGWGLYVWGSYGVTAALMLIEAWLVRRQLRRAQGHSLAPVPGEEGWGEGAAQPAMKP